MCDASPVTVVTLVAITGCLKAIMHALALHRPAPDNKDDGMEPGAYIDAALSSVADMLWAVSARQ